MKPFFLYAALILALASCSSSHDGQVSIKLPKDFSDSTIIVSHMTLDNMFSAKSQDDLKVVYDTLEVKNGTATLTLDAAGAAWYNIETSVAARETTEFYAVPGETLQVDITNFQPLSYTVSGSQLMDDMTAYLSVTRPIKQGYADLLNQGDVTEAQAKDYNDRYDAAIKKFVADHPQSPVVPYIITELSGDDFKTLYDSMTPEAKKSILMPFAETYNKSVESMMAERADEQARQAEYASGNITAPAFTLPDLQGKQVSLSDFRGRWVVLDFWGSWCGWCVKGFPALKEAYKKYGDKIVIIGIDCNESEDDWRAGVKKYDLPWISLYNGDDTALYNDYGISGFPTKVIVNPDGKIVDLTVGEDPSFFTRLDSLITQ